MSSRATTSTKTGAGLAEHRPPPGYLFGVPWVLLAAVVVAGSVAHEFWGTRLPAAALAASGTLAATAVLTALTWLHASGRDKVTRAQAAATVFLAGGAVWRSLAAGVDPGWVSTEVFLGSAVALSWNLRSMRAVRGDGRDHHERTNFAEELGLPGARFGRAKVDGARAEVAVRTANGQDARHVQAAARPAAAMLHLPTNSVRVVPDPGHADRASMVVMTADVLADPVPWPGPSHPGGSMADPLLLGVCEDAEPERLWLPGDWTPDTFGTRSAAHLLVMGASGAGKSGLFKVAAVEVLTRTDSALVVVDVRKGMQLPGWLRDTLGPSLVDTPARAKALLAGLAKAVPARAAYLGAHGWDEWWPGCGIPHLTVWVEEAGPVVEDSVGFVGLAESCRSVGISLVASMQRASHGRIPTDARAQFSAAVCFGLNQRGQHSDAQFALSEATVEAGANPEAWGVTCPGKHYLEAPGVPVQRWSLPCRAYDVRGLADELAAAVAEWAPARMPLDEATAAALGLGGRPAGMARSEDVADDDEYPVPPQPEPELAAKVNPREPIPPWAGENIRLGPPDDGRPPLDRDTKERHFEAILAGFMERGQTDVRMAELVDAWRAQTGQPPSKGRPFLHEMLGRRIDQGQVERLAEGRGVYRLRVLVSPNGHRP
jgi:hypothetical protein